MTTPTHKRFTIFISSSFVDLQDYREAVSKAIRGLGQYDLDMVNWPADERSGETLSLAQVDQADLMILILAHRYGTIPDGETRSITEMEFDAAKKANIPIHAFFVDPKQPWPGDRYDARQYDKLVAFKAKIEKQCVRKYFTTTDSLANLVTQAIVGFSERRSVPAPPTESKTKTTIRPTSSLDELADTCLSIGLAEDGLPLALKISRADDLKLSLEEITKAWGSGGEAGRDERLGSYITEVVRGAEKSWKTRGMHLFHLTTGGIATCYVSKKRIFELYPGTILSLLLPSSALESRTFTLLAESISARPVLMEGQDRFLGVSLSDGKKYVVSRTPQAGDDLIIAREFVDESFENLGGRFEIVVNGMTNEEGSIADYLTTLTAIFKSVMDAEGKATPQVNFRFERRSIAKVVLQLLTKLADDYHARHVVHGDIKPPNCLVGTAGGSLIDGLDVPIGTIAKSITVVWAAPEQIAMRPVAESTDIYPIGLMLVNLLSGMIAGEIVRYLVPFDVGQHQVVPIVRNPSVYLNHHDLTVPVEGEKAWRDFLERCLRFDPTERFQNARECAAQLEALASKFPLQGEVACQLARGEMQMVRDLDGEARIYRVFHDASYSAVLLIKCPRCESVNRFEAKFCQVCGCPVSR